MLQISKQITILILNVVSTQLTSTPELRLRLIIPLAREISEEEYAAGRMVAKKSVLTLFDDTTWWVSTSSNGEFVYEEQEGALLDPDIYLSKYENWRIHQPGLYQVRN